MNNTIIPMLPIPTPTKRFEIALLKKFLTFLLRRNFGLHFCRNFTFSISFYFNLFLFFLLHPRSNKKKQKWLEFLWVKVFLLLQPIAFSLDVSECE